MLLEDLFEDLAIRQRTPTKDNSLSPKSHMGQRVHDNMGKAMKLRNKLNNSEDEHKSFIGNGIEAIVFQSKRPQNQGTVTKWLRNQNHPADSNKVIQYLVQSQQLNNTMMPRVYSVTQYKKPKGMYEYSIQMEKLYTELTNFLQQNAGDQLIEDQIMRQIFTEDEIRVVRDRVKDDSKQLFNEIIAGISYPEQGTSSPQILQAMSFVEKFTGTNEVDIHGSNVMIRLTSVGPQLVLTDPIADAVGNFNN